MTEKQKTLAFVMEHFMYKAKELRKSRYPQDIILAERCDSAAIEVASLGVAQETTGEAVVEYLKRVKIPSLHFGYFNSAILMAKNGASAEVVEKLISFLIKNYCWVWALRDLTALVGRKPTKEEIFAIVQLEIGDMSTLSESLHKDLVSLAKEHLSHSEVERVKSILREKTKEFRSSADW